MDKKIRDKKMVRILFLVCWFAYFSSYIGRLNFSSSMSEMISKNIITTVEAGSINMMFFLSYGVGQFINGFLGDKFKPRYMISVGLMMAAISNLLMGSSTSAALFMVFWGLNGYANSMIWAPILRIFSEHMYIEDTNKACIDIATSMALGTFGSYFLTAIMLGTVGWKGAFLAPGIFLLVIVIIFWFTIKKIEVYIDKNGEEETISLENKSGVSQVPFKNVLFGTGLLMFLMPVIFQGFLKDGATSWVPTYIHGEFSISTSFSSIMTMIIPVVNLTGAYAASFVNQRLQSEAKTSAFFFMVSSIGLMLLTLFGNINPIFSALLLSIVTSSMMAINIMIVNLLPVHFAKYGRVSTVSGFLNASAYIGAAICTYSVGIMLKSISWNMVFLGWFALSAIGGVWCYWLGSDPKLIRILRKVSA